MEFNYDNYDYLTRTAFPKFHDIGTLDDALEREMRKSPRQEEIKLSTETQFGDDKMKYTYNLEFEKDYDRYFLNRIDANLTRNDGTVESQRFNLYAQSGLNETQMHNVVEGRFAWREYKKTNKETGLVENTSGWFYKNENVLDKDGLPVISVLNDNVSKFNLIVEMGNIPLNLTQKQKNDLALELKQGNPMQTIMVMPDGNKEKVDLVVHPQKGIQVFNNQGDKIRFKKSEGKLVVMGIEKMPKISDTTTKLLDAAQNAGQGKNQTTSKGARKSA